MVDISHTIEKGNRENQALAGGGDPRKSICCCIVGASPVLDGLNQILLLFGSLDYLIHQVLQALMVSDNSEGMVEEVVTPFTNRGGDGMELPDVSGGVLQPGAEILAKKHDWMSVLGQHRAYRDSESIYF